jgi:hypothetical protein
MDQNEEFEYKVTMNMSFTREEMVKLATLGMQAAVGVALLDKEATVDFVDQEEEDDVENAVEAPVHIHMSFSEIEKLYNFAKSIFNPDSHENHFTLTEKLSVDGTISDVFVNYANGKAVQKITDEKDWK